ncbi:dihydropteroate synthase [Salinarimonas soli]|uniref:Dihydropteroate synthase n=1 Tax=Salinarimonas soli TaxID=1638099 RepID=A0A5B2VEW0_9HYPH|nr:dihydropteroate synthase [Salinarimonas soli]KAA2237484.1 dihydropteroate synthase [Salinarimonas soli]
MPDPAIAPLPDLGRRTLVMGILNVTPDSFSDGGLFAGRDAAIAHALALEAEGADIIDIGGESTRPGHEPVPAEDEQARVLPVLEALRGRVSAPISIDTYKASTARLALAAGARIVNDVWGLQRDPEIARVAAEAGAPVIAMHNRETIDGALDILDDMRRFFDRTLSIAREAGIPERHIVLDPGIGFGKTWEQHLDALRRLPELKALGFPVLVGVSRKSVLGRIHNAATAPKDRLFGSIASHVVAAMLGADIVRVHDVRAHVEACQVADAILRRP